MINIKDRKIIDFDIVKLESINNRSNYQAFIKDENTPKNVFGNIIVCKDLLGRTREIISGKCIPVIKYIPIVRSTSNDVLIEPMKDVPNSPYRGVKASFKFVAQEEIEEYIRNNNNEEFVEQLNNFIDTSKKCYNKNRNSFVKKLIKR